MAAGRVTVVGLGPAGREHLTVGGLEALDAATVRYLRTERHPVAAWLRETGRSYRALDPLYEDAATLDDAYAGIVDVLVRAAVAGGDVAYGVPGSPSVAEATVGLLVERAGEAGIDVGVVEGVSFVEVACAALGIDAVTAGLTLLDGRRLGEVADVAAGALLVAQVDSAAVLSDAKLALLEWRTPGTEVALLGDAGGPHSTVRRTTLSEVDHDVGDPGPRACLFVAAAAPVLPFEVRASHVLAGRSFARLVALQDRLRSPGGCPWDAAATHSSLARHLQEEAYEVLETIDALPAEAPEGEVPPGAYAAFAEELGDLLMQVVFHARLAEEADAFGAADVVDGIVAKLVHRHPHVFADFEAADAEAVLVSWEEIKTAEKGRESVMDDVPGALPALAFATKLLRRAGAGGVRPALAEEALVVVRAALGRLEAGAAPAAPEMASALFALAVAAGARDVDPEASLRALTRSWAAACREQEPAGLSGTSVWDLLARARQTST